MKIDADLMAAFRCQSFSQIDTGESSLCRRCEEKTTLPGSWTVVLQRFRQCQAPLGSIIELCERCGKVLGFTP